MFANHQLIIKLKKIFIMMIIRLSLCKANNHYSLRFDRGIGGESLDTSYTVLYVSPNGSRFIDVPRKFMENWLTDRKMWRTVGINDTDQS